MLREKAKFQEFNFPESTKLKAARLYPRYFVPLNGWSQFKRRNFWMFRTAACLVARGDFSNIQQATAHVLKLNNRPVPRALKPIPPGTYKSIITGMDLSTIEDRMVAHIAFGGPAHHPLKFAGTVTGRVSSNKPDFQFLPRSKQMSLDHYEEGTHTVGVQFLDRHYSPSENSTAYRYLTNLNLKEGDIVIVPSDLTGMACAARVKYVTYNYRGPNASKWVKGIADMSAQAEQEQRELEERTKRELEEREKRRRTNERATLSRKVSEARRTLENRREQIRQEILNDACDKDRVYQSTIEQINRLRDEYNVLANIDGAPYL